MNKKFTIGIICAAVCETIFGLSYLFTKNITLSFTPIDVLSWRFIIAFIGINLCLLFKVIKVDFKDKSLKPILMTALFCPVIYFTSETFGIELTTASESGTIIASIPIVTLLCSALILKEKPNKNQIVGISITFIGVVITVIVKGLSASFDILGYSMLFMAVLSYSLYSVYCKKSDNFTNIEKTYIMISMGFVFFGALGMGDNLIKGNFYDFIVLPFVNREFLITVLYLGLGASIIAFLLSNTAIGYLGTNKTASFVGLSTVVSILSGIVILSESFTILQLVGSILVLLGVYVSNTKLK